MRQVKTISSETCRPAANEGRRRHRSGQSAWVGYIGYIDWSILMSMKIDYEYKSIDSLKKKGLGELGTD
jgi:hypothetical protein